MAGDISTNNIRIGATISELVENMKKASAAVRGTVSDINGKLADSYKRAGKEQALFRNGLGKLGDDLQGIGTKMAVLGTLPALFAAGKAYKDFGELEKLEKGLTRYGETMKGVREIAKLPNIGVFDSAKNLIGLKAMKMSSDMATRSIKAMANAITDAGGSAIDLDPALLNLKQFKSTQNINQVDLRQLANRIPQTMEAIQNAFGTMDPEKLNKLGIDKFIEGYITELEKIPMVSGGAASAQEQLSDSFLFLSGSLGKAGDSVFGITDKIQGLTGVLDGMTDSLGTADPTMLKLGLSMAALGVTIPLVVTAMGAVVSAGAALAAGLGVAGLAVAGVAAAVVVGGALIITFWDDIKENLTNISMWTSLSDAAKSGLGTLTNTFAIFQNLFKGNWSEFGKFLVTTFKHSANLALNIGGTVAKGLLTAFSGLNNSITFGWIDTLIKKLSFDIPKALGTTVKVAVAKPGQQSIVDSDAYGKQFDIRNDNVKYISNTKASITQLAEKLNGLEAAYKNLSPTEEGYAAKKADLAKQVGQVTNQIETQSAALANSKKKIKETTDAYVAMSEAQLQIWSIDVSMRYAEEQKSLKDKIKSYKELIGVVANLNVETLKGASIQDMKFTPDLGKLAGPASGMGNTIKDLDAKYDKSTDATRWAAAIDLKDYFGSKEDLGDIKKYFDQIPKIAGESAEEYGKKLGIIVSATENLDKALGGNTEFEKLRSHLEKIPQIAGQSARAYGDEIDELVKATEELNSEMSRAMQDASVNIVVGFGEMLGDLATGTGGLIEFVDKVIGTLAEMLKAMGKSLIAAGAAGFAFKTFMDNPVGAVIAGAALTAMGQILGNNLKNSQSKAVTTKFAKGGMAYREMTATVGDNRNARFDPEMIAPYSKVDASIKKSIRETGGGNTVFIPDIKLKGSDLVIVFKRQEKINAALL